MKLFVVAALLALAAARPQEAEYDPTQELRDAGILRMEMSQDDEGNFQYGYETTDPAQQDVVGGPKQINGEVGIASQGSYSFTTQDEEGNNVDVSVSWTADENGFVPSGDVLPVAPEDPNREAQLQAYRDAGSDVTF